MAGTGSKADVTERILQRARALGACAAGITRVSRLGQAPAYRETGRAVRSHGAPSLLVIALPHPPDRPELDWWDRGPGGSRGNRLLMKISAELQAWSSHQLGMAARDVPYSLEAGGVFLKDAAVLAGLGKMGKNNLLLTPEHGPRVRLRALFFDADLEPSPALDFDPCGDCPAPCCRACPLQAFGQSGEAPYARAACDRQMARDLAGAVCVDRWEADGRPGAVVKYCRACELGCPWTAAGRQ